MSVFIFSYRHFTCHRLLFPFQTKTLWQRAECVQMETRLRRMGAAGDECVTPGHTGFQPSFTHQQTHMQQIHWIWRNPGNHTCECQWSPLLKGSSKKWSRKCGVCGCRRETFRQRDTWSKSVEPTRNHTGLYHRGQQSRWACQKHLHE